MYPHPAAPPLLHQAGQAGQLHAARAQPPARGQAQGAALELRRLQEQRRLGVCALVVRNHTQAQARRIQVGGSTHVHVGVLTLEWRSRGAGSGLGQRLQGSWVPDTVRVQVPRAVSAAQQVVGLSEVPRGRVFGALRWLQALVRAQVRHRVQALGAALGWWAPLGWQEVLWHRVWHGREGAPRRVGSRGHQGALRSPVGQGKVVLPPRKGGGVLRTRVVGARRLGQGLG